MCVQKPRQLRAAAKTASLSELERDICELKASLRKNEMRRVLKFLLIGFLFGRKSEKRAAELTKRIKKKMNDNVTEVSKIVSRIKTGGTYLIHPNKMEALSRIESAEAEIEKCEKNNVLNPRLNDEIRRRLNESKLFVVNYNAEFLKQRKLDYKHLWSKGSISLDDEQQTAIVTDDKYNLVVAAAGSGKTEVLITRIAYLIQRRPDFVQPNRILAIAYQRKAKEQIEQRLLDRYGIEDVCVRTFHKLGKDILECSGRIIDRTDIVDENKKFGFIKNFFEEQTPTNPAFYQLFVRYMATVRDKDDEPTEADKNAVLTHSKESSYVSIDGTKVKSKAEKEIMDYLLTHKINGYPVRIKYETDVGVFRPDFYLPQFLAKK